MKRPSYFISSRAGSGDTYAADLVLALREEFPKVDVVGICGTRMLRARVSALYTLEKVHNFHQGLDLNSPSHQSVLEQVEGTITNIEYQTCILVGYSPFHESLAAIFKKHEVPVILYGLTPGSVLRAVDKNLFKKCISQIITILPTKPQLYYDLKMPVVFFGSPLRDRVNRVAITQDTSVLEKSKNNKILTVLPGSDPQVSLPRLAAMMKALGSLENSNLRVFVSLPEELRPEFDQKMEKSLKQILGSLHIAESNSFRLVFDKATVYFGMGLELMYTADLVISGAGSSSLEAVLLGTPCVAYLSKDRTYSKDSAGHRCLANQIAEAPIATEYLDGGKSKLDRVVDRELKRNDDEKNQNVFQAQLVQLRSKLPGLAVETVAKFIGNLSGWAKKSAMSKTSSKEKNKRNTPA